MPPPPTTPNYIKTQMLMVGTATPAPEDKGLCG